LSANVLQTVDINHDLLGKFYRAGGQAVGVSDLKQDLGLSLEEIASAVETLRAAGYVIGKSHPYGSTAFQMLEIPDRFYEHEVRRRLPTEWLGQTIASYETLTSTNDVARTMSADGAPHGTIVVAEEQVEGRGRSGRTWHSARAKGIYVSLILRPGGRVPSVAALQVTTAVAVAHAAMKVTGKPARIRWPNDVLMGRGKIAGILAEASDLGTEDALWIVGIGLNVGHGLADFPSEIVEEASSLSLETGHPLSRLPVLPTLLGTLEEWYDRVFAGELEEVANAWRPLSSILDREVVLLRGEKKTEGTVRDLSPERGILVEGADGQEWIPAEHVTFLRPADDA
jgi:BirA family biotin operon repressor/biotin-[acetyl-CoA-carboxylase] ligase